MTKHLWKIGSVGVMAAVMAWVLASGIITIDIGTSADGAAAAEDERPVHARPSQVAIAIGQLQESDGHTDHEHSTTVDLRASVRDGVAGGALRFLCEEAGYYNGGVRTLDVNGDVITVTGAGGLFRPNGTRIGVEYKATFNQATGETSIYVEGQRTDYSYSMTGVLEGLTTVWEPATH